MVGMPKCTCQANKPSDRGCAEHPWRVPEPEPTSYAEAEWIAHGCLKPYPLLSRPAPTEGQGAEQPDSTSHNRYYADDGHRERFAVTSDPSTLRPTTYSNRAIAEAIEGAAQHLATAQRACGLLGGDRPRPSDITANGVTHFARRRWHAAEALEELKAVVRHCSFGESALVLHLLAELVDEIAAQLGVSR